MKKILKYSKRNSFTQIENNLIYIKNIKRDFKLLAIENKILNKLPYTELRKN